MNEQRGVTQVAVVDVFTNYLAANPVKNTNGGGSLVIKFPSLTESTVTKGTKNYEEHNECKNFVSFVASFVFFVILP